MKKALKITGIVLVVVLILLLTLPYLFRGKIMSLAKEEAAKSVNATIDFDHLSLSLFRSFPDFSFAVDHFSVVGQGQFEGDTLLKVQNLTLTLDLFSVINGNQYEIKKISISKPVINLIVMADSSANWDIAKTKGSTGGAAQQDTASAFKMAIRKFEVRDARISYTDQPNKTVAIADGINFELSGDLSSETTTLSLSSTIEAVLAEYGGVRYLNQAKVQFEARVMADMKSGLYTLEDNKLTVNDLSVMFEGWFKMMPEAYEMDIRFNTPQTDFKSVLSMVPALYSKQFSEVQTKGKFMLSGYSKGTYTATSLPAFGITLSVADAMFQYPAMPAAVSDIGVEATVTNPGGSADLTVTDVKRFHLNMAGNPMDITFRLANPLTDPDLAMTVSGKFDLSSVEKIYPTEQKLTGKLSADLALAGRMSAVDRRDFEQFRADGTLKIEEMRVATTALAHPLNIKSLVFRFSPAFLELASFDGTLGKSDFRASGKITRYLDYLLKDGVLTGNLNLSSTMIDVDELMPRNNGQTQQAQPAHPDSTGMAMLLPDRVDFVTVCNIAQLKYDKATLTNLSGQVTLRNRKLSLDRMAMEAFGGSVQASGHLATPEQKPVELNLRAEMKQIDLQLLAASFSSIDSLAPILKKVKGKTGMNLTFNTLLQEDLSPDLAAIQSQGSLNTSQLIATDIEVMNKAADLLKMDKLKSLTINPTNLSYIIEDGKLLVKPFDIKVDQMAGTLGGTTDLKTQSLDYVLGLQIPRATFGSAANAVVDGLVAEINKKGLAYDPGKNVAVDLLIGGTAKSPKVTMKLGKSGSGSGMADDLKAKATEEFNKKKQELENQAKAEIEKQKAAAEAKVRQEQEKLKQEVEKKKKELETKAKREADSLKKRLEEEAKKKLKKFF